MLSNALYSRKMTSNVIRQKSLFQSIFFDSLPFRNCVPQKVLDCITYFRYMLAGCFARLIPLHLPSHCVKGINGSSSTGWWKFLPILPVEAKLGLRLKFCNFNMYNSIMLFSSKAYLRYKTTCITIVFASTMLKNKALAVPLLKWKKHLVSYVFLYHEWFSKSAEKN